MLATSAPTPSTHPVNTYAPAPNKHDAARGFVLYVALTPDQHSCDARTIKNLIGELKQLTIKHSPNARVHASIARSGPSATPQHTSVIATGSQHLAASAVPDRLCIDLSRRIVSCNKREIAITYKEFEILRHLIKKSNTTVNRTDLISTIWGLEKSQQLHARTIDVHIKRLRNKLGSHHSIIQTVRATGYRFDTHPDVFVSA